jgi:hypothetical protein
MKSVEQSLLEFFQTHVGEVFESGELQRRTWRNKNGTLATPRSVVRRLQELANVGKIKNVGSMESARYSLSENYRKKIQVVHQNPDGSVKVSYV